MGCKESKHIATDNTIITPSSSRRSTNRGQDDKDKSNVQTLQRSTSGRSTMQKQNSLKGNNVGDSKANNVSNEIEKTGDEKGAVDVNKDLEKLKEINDQELIKENEKAANIKEKEDQNGNVRDNGGKESILIPKEGLPSTSNIETINTDGVSGASVYSTPTEVAAGAFENKDTKTEEIAKENLTGYVDANPKNHVREAEVEEKIKEAEAAVATPENHRREAEVEEKIKAAEAAVETLEKLVKEADKVEEILVTEEEAAAANIQNPVKETEEIPVKEVKATNSSVWNLEKEADKPEEIRRTEVEATDATLQKPVKVTDKSDEDRGTETRATDATLQDAVTESGKTNETVIKAGEDVENGVREIHEVTGKAEENPVKEVETSHETDNENQTLVADEAEVLEKEAEADYATPRNPVKEAENAVAEAASTAKENL